MEEGRPDSDRQGCQSCESADNLVPTKFKKKTEKNESFRFSGSGARDKGLSTL